MSGTTRLARVVAGAVIASLAAVSFPAEAGAPGLPGLDQGGEPVVCDIRSTVDRSELGFVYRIPSGLTGCSIWPRAITIPMGAKGHERLIHVGWSYNAPMYGDLDDLRDREGDDSGRSRNRVVTRTTLGGLPALRDVIRDDETGSVQEIIRALSPEKDAQGIPRYEYSIFLDTTPRHYTSDRAVLEEIVASFEIVPVHD